MIRCTTAAIVAVSSILFVAGSAEAQSLRNARYTKCRDANGERVLAVNTTRLNNVGMAGRIRGRPVILFNPVIMRRFQPATRTFWFYHECAHHALGHSLGHRPASRERDADCWAIRQMRQRGLLTSARLRTIEQDLYPLAGDGYLYLPGPQRAAYVGYCATGRRTLPQMVRRNVRRRGLPPAGYRPPSHRYRDEMVARRQVRNRYRSDRYGSEGPVAPQARYRNRHRRDHYGPSGSGLR
jgi:hypothetical protein